MTTKKDYKKLNDYQHARLKTEMYMGSREEHTQSVLHFNGECLEYREFTWVPALYTTFRELLDNALDELIGYGHGDTLRVGYDPDTMEISVQDNGNGLPIKEVPALGKGPGASVLLGEAKAGSNFDERGQVAGTNGLGAAIVNFTAEWFELQVWREGKRLRQKWEEGTYRGKDTHKTKGPSVVRGAKNKRGTLITYKPSAKVYPIMNLPLEFIEGRMWDIAVTNPKLRVFFNGKRLLTKNTTDPIKSTYFSDRPVAIIETKDGSFNSRFYVSPEFTDEAQVTHSLVNNIPAFLGGDQVEAFKLLFFNTVAAGLESKLKKEDLKLKREDMSNGLLIFNVTWMDAPNFDSQTKQRLISNVKKHVKNGFKEWDVQSMLRRNPEWVQVVLDRCRERSLIKDSRDVKKAQKKNVKVAALTDANNKDRSKCVMFIGEGQSAISNMVSVRDPKIHGGIRLRGKILNVWNMTPKKVLDSKGDALTDIMSAVGLIIGEKAVRSNLRYNTVYIATDEDEDGKNITALLVAFFYKFWPELFQDKKNPFLFKFSTPFIIATKGKQTKYFYAHDYDDFLNSKDKFKGWTVTRAKGLGSLTLEDWEHSLYKPVTIPLVDDGGLKETLDLIFNKTRADDRKEWLANVDSE